MTSARKKFILRGGYSNVNGWHSKIILINKVNKQNRVFMRFYADTDGRQPIMKHNVTLEPFEIRSIELDFEQLRERFGRIDLKSDDMLDGNVATMRGDDSIIDLRLVRPDVICC
jgi:hypothetical protein